MLRPHLVGDSDSKFVKVYTRKKVDFYFINLDLELESTESVQPLIKELQDDILSAYCGGFDNLGCLELPSYRKIDDKEVNIYNLFDDAEDWVGGADLFINEFCDLIENLSASSKKIWDKCTRKEFDLGFQCGNTSKTFKTSISDKTVKRCAELGASIMFTVYPHHNYDFVSKKELKEKKKRK